VLPGRFSQPLRLLSISPWRWMLMIGPVALPLVAGGKAGDGGPKDKDAAANEKGKVKEAGTDGRRHPIWPSWNVTIR
jgi:hypothetical protein